MMFGIGSKGESKSKFAGVKSIRSDVFRFVLSHYRVDSDSTEIHGDFLAKGQEGNLTHFHTFEASVGYGEHIILRLNTMLFEEISDESVALEFVNALNVNFSHSQTLSHCVYYPDTKNIASSSQTMLANSDHNFLHDVISNHILNNKWFTNFAMSPEGLNCSFELGVQYDSDSEIAH